MTAVFDHELCGYYQYSIPNKDGCYGSEEENTDKRIDDLRQENKEIQVEIRQIRHWLFAGEIAIVAILIGTLLKIFIGS